MSGLVGVACLLLGWIDGCYCQLHNVYDVFVKTTSTMMSGPYDVRVMSVPYDVMVMSVPCDVRVMSVRMTSG